MGRDRRAVERHRRSQPDVTLIATAPVRWLDLNNPPPPHHAIDKREVDPRKALATHGAAREHSFASLSAMIRRSPGYLGRLVRQGVPAALSERDHRVLAVWGADDRGLGVRNLWA